MNWWAILTLIYDIKYEWYDNSKLRACYSLCQWTRFLNTLHIVSDIIAFDYA